MSAIQTITIKDYFNAGGDLKLEVKDSIISEKAVGNVRVIRLKVTRKPDKHSTRLGMFAYIRNTQAGYQSLGFPQVTLTFDRYAADGKFVSRALTEFFDVAVESSVKKGDDEEITFIAGRKSDEVAISKVP